MSSLQLSSNGLLASFKTHKNLIIKPSSTQLIKLPKGKCQKIRAAVGTDKTIPADSKSEPKELEAEPEPEKEPKLVNLAFVHSVLLPDGTPDVHFRTAPGGQKLRDIMLDTNIDLYGPYDKPLSNCAGGGSCATCMVEIIAGKELLNPRTKKEKENLKKKPKDWRLACQITVGNPDSTGLLVVQQLPEWKSHEWGSERISPSEILDGSLANE